MLYINSCFCLQAIENQAFVIGLSNLLANKIIFDVIWGCFVIMEYCCVLFGLFTATIKWKFLYATNFICDVALKQPKNMKKNFFILFVKPSPLQFRSLFCGYVCGHNTIGFYFRLISRRVSVQWILVLLLLLLLWSNFRAKNERLATNDDDDD